VLAQDVNTAYLNLSLYDGGNFTAVLDDKDELSYSNEMEFDNLNSGRHYLKVMRETNALSKLPDIIFSNYIDVPSGCKLYAVIDEYGKFSIYKKICSSFYKKKHTHEHECNCNCENCKNCIYKNKRWDDETRRKDDCKYNVMSVRYFGDLKSSIGSKSFESTKLEVMKQAIDINYLSVEQVKELLLLLDFESSRIEIAKYAYDKTCDKKNYFIINDVFSFESSISDLESYIREKNK